MNDNDIKFVIINQSDLVLFVVDKIQVTAQGIMADDTIIVDRNIRYCPVDKSIIPNDAGRKPRKYFYSMETSEFIENEEYFTGDVDIDAKILELIRNYPVDKRTDEEMTLEEVIDDQVKIVGKQCDEVIYNGIEVELSDGNNYNFSLTMKDQANIEKLVKKIEQGITLVPYHNDKTFCRIYTVEDFLRISTAADLHIFYHTTYCNSINTWIRSCTTKEQARQIQYGMELPEPIKSEFELLVEIVMGEYSKLPTMVAFTNPIIESNQKEEE